MDGLNRVMLIGNLGFDPELRGAGGERSALKLRIATTESYFDKRDNTRKETTSWHNAVVFGRRGEALFSLLRKGSKIYVEGRLETSSYEKNGVKMYSTSVVVDKLIFMDGGRGASQQEREFAGMGSPAPSRQQEFLTRARGSSGSDHEDFGGGDYADGYNGADDDIPF